MRGVNVVLLACFPAALRNPAADSPGLSAGAQVAAQHAIRCVRYLTDFCLMAENHSHTPQRIGYMD